MKKFNSWFMISVYELLPVKEIAKNFLTIRG